MILLHTEYFDVHKNYLLPNIAIAIANRFNRRKADTIIDALNVPVFYSAPLKTYDEHHYS